MKKINYMLGISLAALCLASCENFFDEKQLHNNYTITDVRNIDYEMTSNDYKSVVENKTNIALALGQCTPEDSSAYAAFTAIKDNLAFSEAAPADMYAPAFLHALYPQLSTGSLIYLTYNFNDGRAEYLDKIEKNAVAYTLTSEDYAEIWGKEGIEYLTPKTVSKLASVLPTDKADSSFLVVSYEYKNYEPSSTGGEEEEEKGFYWGTPEQRGYYSPTEVVEAYTAGTLVAGDTISVGGILSEWYSTSYPAKYKNLSYYLSDGTNKFEMYNSFSINKDSIDAFEYDADTKIGTATDRSGRTFTNNDTIIGRGAFTYYASANVYEFSKGCYITELRPAKKANAAPHKVAAQADGTVSTLYQYVSSTWKEYTESKVTLSVLPNDVYKSANVTYISDLSVINSYLKTTYPYAAADSKYAVVYKIRKGYGATEYVYDGTKFVENNGINKNKATFSLNGEWGSTIYYKQAIMGEGQGKLTIQNIELDGLTYVWSYASSYGMKATSYANSSSHVVESWLVTPAISIKRAKKPGFNFDQAVNYGPTDINERMAQCAVLISTNYAGDVTTCDWELLEYPKDGLGNYTFPETNSWTFYNTDAIDLSKYAGQEIYIGFRYKTLEGQSNATWEIKNLLVEELSK